MKKKLLISVSCVLLLCMALLACADIFSVPETAVAANKYDEKIKQFEEEMKNLDDRMKVLEAERREKMKDRSALMQEISSLDLQISANEDRQLSIKNHISALEYDMEVLMNNIKTTEERLEKRREIFADHLVSIYTIGDISLLDVLFASSSFKDFITNYDMLENVLAQDTVLLNNIKSDIAGLNADKEGMETTRMAWFKLNDQILQEQAKLETLKGEKEQKRKDLQSDINTIAAAYDELERDSNALEGEIEELQRLSRVEYDGTFSWPLPDKYNYITSDYKMRMHPIKHVYKMHTGIDIRAPKNTKIYASSPGEVILSKYYGSYGETVIIDHGAGMATLYAHMNKRNVKVGDTVKRGDIIGFVGTTGSSTGNHLHFEFRKNGKHTSPWDYVTKP